MPLNVVAPQQRAESCPWLEFVSSITLRSQLSSADSPFHVALKKQLYESSPGLRYTTFALVQAVFSAATTNLLAAALAGQLGQTKKAADATRSFEACIRFFRPLKTPCLVTQHCYTALSNLANDRGLLLTRHADDQMHEVRLFLPFPHNGKLSLTSPMLAQDVILPCAAPPLADFGPLVSADGPSAPSGNPVDLSFPEAWLADVSSVLGTDWLKLPPASFEWSVLDADERVGREHG